MAWFGRKKTKEEKHSYDRSTLEAEQMIADISGCLRQLDNLPGAQRSAAVVSQQANDSARKIEVKRFEEKFNPLGYTEISHELMMQKMGLRKDDPILSDKALDMLKGVEPSCVMSDFLLPYLLEKEKSGIINSDELSQLNGVRARMDNNQFRKVAGATSMLIGMILGDQELARKFEVAYDLYLDFLVEKECAPVSEQPTVSSQGRRI